MNPRLLLHTGTEALPQLLRRHRREANCRRIEKGDLFLLGADSDFPNAEVWAEGVGQPLFHHVVQGVPVHGQGGQAEALLAPARTQPQVAPGAQGEPEQ